MSAFPIVIVKTTLLLSLTLPFVVSRFKGGFRRVGRGGGGARGLRPLFSCILKRFCNRLSSGIMHSIVLKNPLKVYLPKPNFWSQSHKYS